MPSPKPTTKPSTKSTAKPIAKPMVKPTAKPIAKPKPHSLQTIQRFLSELEWDSSRKYVDMLESRGELLRLGQVDVDVPQIVRRHFICDARRCIECAGTRPLVDRGCCCRYEVPLTARDRAVVLAHLDDVRPRLPEGHRLHDPATDPFKVDDDYGFQMVHDNELGGCQFNLYHEGQCRCALHGAALAAGENPQDWKPIACSLWPLAINAYTAEGGEERFILTVYCEETGALFDDTEDDPFACIVDQDPSYPRTYESERSVLEYLFGEAWWQELDQAARVILAPETKTKTKKKPKTKNGTPRASR